MKFSDDFGVSHDLNFRDRVAHLWNRGPVLDLWQIRPGAYHLESPARCVDLTDVNDGVTLGKAQYRSQKIHGDADSSNSAFAHLPFSAVAAGGRPDGGPEAPQYPISNVIG